MPSLSFEGEGQSVQLRDRRRTDRMTGGATGVTPYQKYVRAELGGSPA